MNILDTLDKAYVNYCDSVSRASEVPLYEHAREYTHKAIHKVHRAVDTIIATGIVAYCVLDDIINQDGNVKKYEQRKR